MPGISSLVSASSTRRSSPQSGEVSTSPRVLRHDRRAARSQPRHPADRAAKEAPGIGAEDALRLDRAPQLVERLDAAAEPGAARGQAGDVDAAGRDAGQDRDLELGPQRRDAAQHADLVGAAGAAAGEEQGERAALGGGHRQRIVVDAHARRAGRARSARGSGLTIAPCPNLAISSSSAADPAATSPPSAPRSSASRSPWSKRTRSSAAPACTAAASRPRRSSTPPTCSRTRATAPSSASPATSRGSTSRAPISTSRRWCARTRRASSRCSASTRSRRCRVADASTARAAWWSRARAARARSTPATC